MYRRILPFVFLTFLTGGAALAQISESPSNDNITFLASFAVPTTNDWFFYADEEAKVYYIDFEMISVNLNDLKVYNQEDELVYIDQLWDLPVNAIYELDLREMVPGRYRIELRSYTGLLEKDIHILN